MFLIAIVLFSSGCYVVNSEKYFEQVIFYSEKYQLKAEFLFALIYSESKFNESAISSKGAIGLMQLTPSTAFYVAELCGYKGEIDLFNADCNLSLGCEYILYLQKKFDCEETLLCAYNAGEGRVKEWLNNKEYSSDGKTLSIIPYKETERYIKKVSEYKKKYKKYLQRKV